MPEKNNSCALICAYNEEKTIGDVVRSSSSYVNKVIVVDDGSSDRTAEFAKKAGAVLLQHKENMGKGAAIKTGLNYFLKKEYKYIITLDADGQHLPSEIPLLIKKLNEGYDAVIGKRDFKKAPLVRRIGNRIDSRILSMILSKEVHDAQSGFRIFTRKAADAALKHSKEKGFHYEVDVLIKLMKKGHDIGWADITTIYDEDRKSKIKPIKHIYESIKIYLRCLKN